MEYFIVGAIIVLIVVIAYVASQHGGVTVEPPHKAAGRRGERAATRRIRSVLREDDALFTNVSISFEGRPAELDNVVVNKNGVFIIEVKNYSGRLYGAEDDFEWTKVHVSDAGNAYAKTVKNPIRQVRRETYILAKYLNSRGAGVWVDGYAMILGATSPVKSGCILSSDRDIDRAIHTPGKKRLNEATVNAVVGMLS